MTGTTEHLVYMKDASATRKNEFRLRDGKAHRQKARLQHARSNPIAAELHSFDPLIGLALADVEYVSVAMFYWVHYLLGNKQLRRLR